MKHRFFRNSKCLGSWLHRFNIIEEYPDGVLELCEVCKKTKFFKIINGKVDNQEYMNWHIRSALPASHNYYDHEFNYQPYSNEIISPYVS